MTDLTNKVAVITGAAGEIPFATARLVAKAGAKLVLTDVNTDRMTELARSLPSTAEPLLLRQDVSDPQDAQSLAAQCRAVHGQVDVVINAAGLYEHLPLTQLSAAAWRRTMAVNLDGVFHTIHALHPLLSDGRAVVNIASHAGHQGSHEHSAYAAAKGGVLALTRSLARELAPRTRVNAVSPGLVDTAMLTAMEDTRRAALTAATPMGRLGTAQDIAQAVLFLSGPDSAYVNGAALHANGGMYMAG